MSAPIATRMTTRHLVLIHGAWQGGWTFDAWRPHLQARGWQVHALDLPGNGWGPKASTPASLDSYVEHVVQAIEAIGEPVVLLGHSGGGVTASAVAERIPERIACLVYLAGMMLPSGTGFAELMQRCRLEQPELDLSGIGPYLYWDGELSSVPPDAALRIFLHDCEPGAADRAANLLRPQAESGRALIAQLSPERWGRVPRIYVEALADRSVALPLQRRMQALSPGAQRLSLDCGHVPQLAQPALLTQLLCDALETRLPL